jgi:hypothetical protein
MTKVNDIVDVGGQYRSMPYRVTERYAFGWTDWRTVYPTRPDSLRYQAWVWWIDHRRIVKRWAWRVVLATIVISAALAAMRGVGGFTTGGGF